ncbi:RagB/SusD family nutrient uptake outer membrane protein [Marinifilum fragile]|uniref:RagB/SusD family nutrient uptake outer membrane protein n=1 Tax=Marinifilum fragile TaxID=570161 RepID=UPI002AABA854|nr:RagB/SusD family nutrient uptake outer membrane protein [Marinifilum fragile]
MKNTLYIILFAFLLTGCDDFLDVTPKGKVIPSEVKDYDLLLNGGSSTIHTTSDEDLLFLSADDFYSDEGELGDLNDPNNQLLRIYRWEKELFPDMVRVQMWENSYNSIYTYNLIIEEIENASITSTYTEEDVKQIKSEARTVRAYEYWLLVNSFAKQYDASTASTDAGVPLVTVADASAKTNERASVKEVYDFLLTDLKEALEFLPDVPENKIRPTKATGYALLARIYLQMGEYELARTNATMALNIKNTLGDYTNMDLDESELNASEQFMYRFYGYTRGFTNGYFSDDLVALYDLTNDMRVNRIAGEAVKWVYDPATGWQQVPTGKVANLMSMDINHCVSVPEMYVIRAECNARLSDGSLQEVIDDLNTLRNTRIVAYTDLTNLDITDKTEALKLALEERRREMVMTGMRWFDLKRLNKESEHAITITHPLGDSNYTLLPNSSNYVFSIPIDVISFNPDMEQNVRE